jgi:dextranase
LDESGGVRKGRFEILMKPSSGIPVICVCVCLFAVGVFSADAQSLPCDTVGISVVAGWNLLSIPLEGASNKVALIFPSAALPPYAYRSGYEESDSLIPGYGYWCKFDSAATVRIGGSISIPESIVVKKGWNLVGSVGSKFSISLAATSPAGIIASNYFQYVPGTGYLQTDTLVMGEGYWLKVNADGLLILTPLQPSPISITTDRASYNPGDTITFSVGGVPAGAHVRYKYLGQVLADTIISTTSWTWLAPQNDFCGYMVELYNVQVGVEYVYATIGVDVSSDWTKFPRYGFLSSFGNTVNIPSVISNLNRYHVNGLQFYDWENRHDKPLAGTPENPDTIWQDIAGRNTYLSTVQGYITAAHQKNMKAMFYNLAYGATDSAAADGVMPQWYVYKDNAHTTEDVLVLPQPPFVTNLAVLNSADTGWQNYLSGRTNDVYTVFNFDGYHIDQLGDQGTVYNYAGTPLTFDTTFPGFINAMKNSAPAKRLTMNAVNQYGQTGIALTPVDFLYTEVWSPNEAYQDLGTLLTNNSSYSGGQKKTVFAAYMDYNLANNPGYFNTPGVLMADAVIFALGGDHLEIGEHMLGQEYFPNSNLLMRVDLKTMLPYYYDFAVAYENLLRDSGAINSPAVSVTDGAYTLRNWPPQTGVVSVIGRSVGSRQVLNLLNFVSASSLLWRDTNGSMAVPSTVQNLRLSVTGSQPAKSVWIASPDIEYGTSHTIQFQQVGNNVTFTVPSLLYWDMVVIQY